MSLFVKSILSLALLFGTGMACAAATVFDADEVQATGLTKEQARQILALVLKHKHYDLSMPGMLVNDDLSSANGISPHPGYIDFNVVYTSSTAGLDDYDGLFVVSPATGDIWELNDCTHFVYADLKHVQELIMQRTGKTLAGEVAQRSMLGCTNE